MNRKTDLNKICEVIRDGESFLVTAHKSPDVDAIASALALGQALRGAEKEVVLLTESPLGEPFKKLKGADTTVQDFDPEAPFDALFVLDCAEWKRLGDARFKIKGRYPIINIDHHETNDRFGDLNWVEKESSSTGEMIYRLIKMAGLPMALDIAENVFAAIQADTGSFRYENTTASALNTAAETLAYGVRPWDVSQRVMDGTSRSRLKLLEMALSSMEFYHSGKVGIMTLSQEMFKRAGANGHESERFIDYIRSVTGVEVAVLISERSWNEYKFSLRSNHHVNVARLADRFHGGGHAGAAGFECHGPIGVVKRNFIKETERFLDGTYQGRNTSG